MFAKSLIAGIAWAAVIFQGGISMAASPEESKKVITDYYAAYGSGDMSKVVGFFAEDIMWHIPGQHPSAGTKHGKAEVATFFEQLGRSNFRAELIALMADDNWVIDMHRGWSNRDTGQNVHTVWVLAFRIENGKIAELATWHTTKHRRTAFFGTPIH
jgi:uncharacterized protein